VRQDRFVRRLRIAGSLPRTVAMIPRRNAPSCSTLQPATTSWLSDTGVGNTGTVNLNALWTWEADRCACPTPSTKFSEVRFGEPCSNRRHVALGRLMERYFTDYIITVNPEGFGFARCRLATDLATVIETPGVGVETDRLSPLKVSPRVQVSVYDPNNLRVEAMAGNFFDKEALVQKLLWAETWTLTFRA
jgi:hypothetical protein